MRSRTVIVILALSAACAAFSASAQRRDAMKACEADLKTHCAGVERGDGRIAQCLRDNQDKLSEGCKKQMKAMASRKKEQRGPQGASAPQ